VSESTFLATKKKIFVTEMIISPVLVDLFLRQG